MSGRPQIPAGRRERGISPTRAGLLVLVLLAAFGYWAYTQANPFASPFTFSAAFETANNLKAGSPVRIAGVDVGEVTAVEAMGDRGAARVEMQLADEGLPVHRDAELEIRPRIFLEGNFFVDLKPGSPSAPVLEDGEQIPLQQTATPVQLADLLAALESDTRSDLQTFLDQYGRALRGRGARGLNQVYAHGADAYRLSAQVNEAALGRREDDLSRLIHGQQRAFGALARHPEHLSDLVTDFNRFAGALAREDRALEAAVPALDDVLQTGHPALASVNGSLPAVRAFARDALPGVRSAAPTLEANQPFIVQARRLVGEAELRGLARDLRPAIPDLVSLNRGQVEFQEQLRALSACQNRVLLPFAGTPIPDPEFPDNSNQPFSKQAPRALVGLAGESRLFDSITPVFHFNFGSGPLTLAQPGEDGSRTFGTATFPPLGVRPVRPLRRPDFRPGEPCELQDPPDMNAVAGPPDAEVVHADAAPTSAADRRRTQREARALELLIQHMRDARAGRPTLDPLRFTPDFLERAARLRSLRLLPDGRYERRGNGGLR